MTHNLCVHIICLSNQWESIYVGVPSRHELSKTRKSFNVSNAESDVRSQDQRASKVISGVSILEDTYHNSE